MKSQFLGKRNHAGSSRTAQQYLEALLAGDDEQASSVVKRASAARGDVLKVYLDLLQPAMIEIGELWCRGKINIAQEHLATQMTLTQMDKLRAADRASPSLGYQVLVASVEGEQHFLGAMMVADAFRLDGWKVDFLGPNVPTRDLLAIGGQRRSHLTALSVTLESNLTRLRSLSQHLRKKKSPAKILVGGHAFQLRPAFARELGFDYASDPFEAVRMARGLVGAMERDHQVPFNAVLKQLGSRIRALRNEKGWTQQQLAERAALNRSFIVAVELGGQNLSLRAVMKVAGGFGISMEELLFLSGKRWSKQ